MNCAGLATSGQGNVLALLSSQPQLLENLRWVAAGGEELGED